MRWKKGWIWAMLLTSFGLAFAASGLQPFGNTVTPGAGLDAFAAFLDKQVPELLLRYDIPGASLALVANGELAWSGAYGYADAANQIPMTTKTTMRVQSISKPITAWGVMRLVQTGKIDLDAPAADYLTSWRFSQAAPGAEHITIRQLLSHTAGLPLGDVFTIYAPGEAMPSLREKLTAEAVPVREPGSSFSYSNTGYNLLELLIEDVTGQEFSDYMRQEVLRPLNMVRSTFDWSDLDDLAIPVGYRLNGDPVPAYVYPEKGSGGLFATAEDLAAFAICGMINAPANAVLSRQAIEALHSPVSQAIGVYGLVFDGYALGHYVETLPGGHLAVAHGGQGTGIMTHYHAVPETGDALVILTNSQRSWPAIARLLCDWSRWRNLGTVGMGRIIWGQAMLWVLIGMVWSGGLVMCLRILQILVCKNKDSTLLSGTTRLGRILRIGAAVSIVAILAWCSSQRYLFLASVFPRATEWLGVSLLVLAVVLLLTAAISRHLPRTKDRHLDCR